MCHAAQAWLKKFLFSNVIVISMVHGGIGIVFAQSPENSNKVDELLFESFVSGRQTLISGEFTAIETNRERVGFRDEIAKSTLYGAFDNLQGTYRFDRTEIVETFHIEDGQLERKADIENLLKGIVGQEKFTTKIIVEPKKATKWSSSNLHEILIAGSVQDLSVPKPFDIRIVGISTTGDLATDYTFDELTEIFRKQKPHAEKAAIGLDMLKWTFSNGSLSRTVKFDPSLDFAPTEMVIANVYNKDGALTTRPFLKIVTTWEEKEGVYVPKTCIHYDLSMDTERIIYEVNFQWNIVNGALPSGVFSPEGLGMESFASVIDTRSGSRVVVDRIFSGAKN